MRIEAHIDTETIERLGKQGRLLLRIYRREFGTDPTSDATERSRSNIIALRDSISLIYGQAVALEVANSLGPAAEVVLTDERAG
jgi:hypothetical protein